MALLERLARLWDDLPTRVALAGVVVWLAVSCGVFRWASQHYVRSAATGWRGTTRHKFAQSEWRATERPAYEIKATIPPEQSDSEEVT